MATNQHIFTLCNIHRWYEISNDDASIRSMFVEQVCHTLISTTVRFGIALLNKIELIPQLFNVHNWWWYLICFADAKYDYYESIRPMRCRLYVWVCGESLSWWIINLFFECATPNRVSVRVCVFAQECIQIYMPHLHFHSHPKHRIWNCIKYEYIECINHKRMSSAIIWFVCVSVWFVSEFTVRILRWMVYFVSALFDLFMEISKIMDCYMIWNFRWICRVDNRLFCVSSS